MAIASGREGAGACRSVLMPVSYLVVWLFVMNFKNQDCCWRTQIQVFGFEEDGWNHCVRIFNQHWRMGAMAMAMEGWFRHGHSSVCVFLIDQLMKPTT